MTMSCEMFLCDIATTYKSNLFYFCSESTVLARKALVIK